MSTSSTSAQLKTIAQRIQAYTGPSGSTVNTLCGGRIYLRQPAADAPFPHLVVRKVSASSDREFQNLRELFELEVTAYARSRSGDDAVDDIADLVQQALLSWVESSPTLGATFTKSVRRDRLSFVASPADPEVVAVRLLFECASWPIYATAAL
jgi:hypothetical protein